jgi:hypothetical protein
VFVKKNEEGRLLLIRAQVVDIGQAQTAVSIARNPLCGETYDVCDQSHHHRQPFPRYFMYFIQCRLQHGPQVLKKI